MRARLGRDREAPPPDRVPLRWMQGRLQAQPELALHLLAVRPARPKLLHLLRRSLHRVTRVRGGPRRRGAARCRPDMCVRDTPGRPNQPASSIGGRPAALSIGDRHRLRQEQDPRWRQRFGRLRRKGDGNHHRLAHRPAGHRFHSADGADGRRTCHADRPRLFLRQGRGGLSAGTGPGLLADGRQYLSRHAQSPRNG